MSTTLADICKKVREDLGLNQIDFAAKCGLSSSTLASIEANHVDIPTLATVKALAKGLGVPYADLWLVVGGEVPESVERLVMPLWDTILVRMSEKGVMAYSTRLGGGTGLYPTVGDALAALDRI